jgi:hypothetical protein
VVDEEYVLQRLSAIAVELRAIRDRICDPKSNDNPRYHGLSLAVGKTHARRWHDSGRPGEARTLNLALRSRRGDASSTRRDVDNLSPV